jgi:hypothetical protein
VPIAELGPALDPAGLVRVELPDATPGTRRSSSSTASATSPPTCAATTAARARVSKSASPSTALRARRGDVRDVASGELILYEDSYGMVTLAISNGNAARLTGAAVGDELRIQPA